MARLPIGAAVLDRAGQRVGRVVRSAGLPRGMIGVIWQGETMASAVRLGEVRYWARHYEAGLAWLTQMRQNVASRTKCTITQLSEQRTSHDRFAGGSARPTE